MTHPSFMISWLLAALGKKLLSVIALFHVFPSERESSPEEISLLFESLEFGRLYSGRDGASLCFASNPIVSCDLGEYGKQDTFCISNDPIFSNVVGRKLVSASLVHSLVEETVIGITLSFEENARLSILNLGDEIFVYDEIPEEVIIDEGVNLISVS